MRCILLTPHRLYKTVFPQGLPPAPGVSATLAVPSAPSRPLGLRHKQSDISLASASSVSLARQRSHCPPRPRPSRRRLQRRTASSRRWVGNASTPALPVEALAPDGPVEDLIVAGTAFASGCSTLFSRFCRKRSSASLFFRGGNVMRVC